MEPDYWYESHVIIDGLNQLIYYYYGDTVYKWFRKYDICQIRAELEKMILSFSKKLDVNIPDSFYDTIGFKSALRLIAKQIWEVKPEHRDKIIKEFWAELARINEMIQARN